MTHVVRAFSTDGRPLWRAVVGDRHAQQVGPSRTRPNGLRMTFAGVQSGAGSVAVDGRGTVLVSVAVSDLDADVTRYVEWRLRPGDGQPVGRAAGRARVVAVHGGRRYGYLAEPVPQVVIH